MATSPFSRRGFLRGAGSLAVGLPLMASLGGRGRAAGPTTFPKRLVIMFSPNGTIPGEWSLRGGEYNFEMSELLAPLEPHRDDLLVLSGIDMASAKHGPGDGHQTGMGHMLTGRTLLEGDLFAGGGDSGYVGWASGPSVDQVIANEIGRKTKFKSLELGCQVHGSTVWSRMSYAASNQPIPPENNPHAVFDRVFGDVAADPVALAKRRIRRQSVLDRVHGEYAKLVPRLDHFDRLKLEQHLTAIREVEKRLAIDTTGVTDYCVVPRGNCDESGVAPSSGDCFQGGLDAMDPANFEAVGRLQMDMLTAALACDLTRVATLQFSQSVSGHAFKNLGIQHGHHDLSHEPDSNAEAKASLVKINQWYAAQMAYLINAMKQVPEGDGTMLDNTVILWVNELGKGNSHTRDDVPYVLAGNAGGYFKTGRYLNFPGNLRNHNDLLLTLTDAMGLQLSSFGDPRFSTGLINELRG
ncbi:MAG: hypothetical protein ACI9MR_005046 [Myxococcota bacterium]|jgi:hypothetical protein